MMNYQIRNFCIIAHIDHGKSTLADRLLEFTHTIEKRNMKEQILDTMDIERERGITIKLQPARMEYFSQSSSERYILNLIDTPGHVDFTYEVSRSLAAVEGALLVVDATQGVQAQTLSNLYLALEQNLTIIPVINKIDLANADPEKVAEEMGSLFGMKREEIIFISAKEGTNIEKVINAIIARIPAPRAEAASSSLSYASAQALIFDSFFDDYKGVVAYVRVMEGALARGDKIRFLATGKIAEVHEVGVVAVKLIERALLSVGEIGYVVTGVKEIHSIRVGDTITRADNPSTPLPGYKEVKPMVFAGLFAEDADRFSDLRDAIEKLKLNDSSLSYEPENSQALGFGFRVGFLGLLHLEIVQERLKREYGLDIIVTAPSVAYKIYLLDGSQKTIKRPDEFPQFIEHVEEPWMRVDIITPDHCIGSLLDLLEKKRGIYKNLEYISSGDSKRALLSYELPLKSVLVDFYDQMKSLSQGYASFNYEFLCYRTTLVKRLDILVAEEKVEALSSIVYSDEVYAAGKRIVETLKENLEKQMFVVKIQAAVNGKVVAAERLSALRKDVTAKLYGGDVTRKRKLLEKQKRGKTKMIGFGKVKIGPEVFLKILKK